MTDGEKLATVQHAESLFEPRVIRPKPCTQPASQIPPDQSVDIPATIWSLTTDLTQPPGTPDPETRIRILTVRGILQTNQDAAQALATWEEVEGLQGNCITTNGNARAIGEQGIADSFSATLSRPRKR